MSPRAYDNANRARLAAQTTERIAQATEALLLEVALPQVTLAAIAARAGVTVQTVLRHMGSRDGCLLAVGDRVAARVARQRGQAPPGDVDAALDELVEHYEAEGRLVLRLLEQEAGDPFAREGVAAGRAAHRAWVARCFGPLLGDPDEATLDALVGATDLYLWKLYRLDLGRPRADTRALLARHVRALLEHACAPS